MNTKLLTLIFLLGASGSGQLFAQRTERQTPQPRPSREQMEERLLKHFDKDGDGVLSQLEREAAHQEIQMLRQERHMRRGDQSEGERMPPRRGQIEGERRQGRGGSVEGEQLQRRRAQPEGGNQQRARGPRGQDQGLERPNRERRGPAEGEQLQRRRGQSEGEGLQRQRRARGQEQGLERPNRERQGLEQRGQGRGQAQQRPTRERDQARGDQRPTREERRARIMQHFDANGDGQLDEIERARLHEAMQSRRGQTNQERPTQGARQGRGRQGRESANAPRSDRRQFPR